MHETVSEWGHVKLDQGRLSRDQADALLAEARAHPLAHNEATNILIDRRDRLIARQMVGMVASKGCSIEILPKVDPDLLEDLDASTVRHRLVRMLDVALGLNLNLGRSTAIDSQSHTLLEILIQAFADKLLAEVRRGLPRQYQPFEDDLPSLRGRLDVTLQFTRNAVRPDRLACRFDQLDADTPLMRVMAAAVVYLGKFAQFSETRRKLDELRFVLVDIPLTPIGRLPWKQVRINRTNRRWESLFHLAQLLLRRDWQATHHDSKAPEGFTLLFPMNDLFEKYIVAMIRKSFAGTDIHVIDQGGHRACLGQYSGKHLESGKVFSTRPDIILRRQDKILSIIDTKWKKLSTDPLDKKHGVSQADVYQLMAYARLYPTPELMLLYPEVPGQTCGEKESFGIAGGSECLSIATIDASLQEPRIVARLGDLFEPCLKGRSQT
jgi:5-methylcytosine-specific restriction enzyme subunit McrC